MRGTFLSEDIIDPVSFHKTYKEQWEEKTEECKILDVPLITVNKLVFKSQLEKETYKPVELLSYADIISHLKRESLQKQQGAGSNAKTQDSKTLRKVKPSASFMKKLQERKQASSQDDDNIPPHPHPFNRYKRNNADQIGVKTLKARSVLLEMSDEIEEMDSLAFERSDKHSELEKKFENFMKWLNQAKQDYVAMETIHSIDEFQILFKLLEKYTSPTLLQIKLNANGTWTVVCQQLEDFKKDYMVLRIGVKYCLCLEPF